MPTEAPPSLRLLGGPYRPPRFKVGDFLYDIIRGDVKVHGMTNGVIQWPMSRDRLDGRKGTYSIVVCGELIAALHAESSIAISHHFGISGVVVTRLRKTLGIRRFNRGTTELWRELASVRFRSGRGPRGGKFRFLTPEQKQDVLARAAAGETRTKIATDLGISRVGVLKILRKHGGQ